MNAIIKIVKKTFLLFKIKIKDLISFTIPNLLTIFLEIVGLILIPIFFSIIMGSGSKNYPLINSIFQDTSRDRLLLIIGISFIVIFIFKNILIIFLKAIIRKITLIHLISLRTKLLKSYQDMKYSNFIKKEKITYVRNLTEHTERSSVCLEEIFRSFSETIVLITIAIYLIILNPTITISFLLILFLVIFFYINFFKIKVYNFGLKRNVANQNVYQNIYENFSGFKEITLLNKHGFFYNIILKNLSSVYINELKYSIITQSPRHIIELAIVCFATLLILLMSLNNTNAIDLFETLSVYFFALLRIMPSASNILGSIVKIGYNKDSLDIIYNDVNSNQEKEFRSIKQKSIFKKISFKNIYFKYPNTKNWILKKLNLTINEYDCIGIIGDNGSGKSTLIDILLGLLRPNLGEIYLNNKKIKTNKMLWHNSIGYLPQEKLILNKSIGENIALENYQILNENKISEIYKSLKQTNIQKKINSLPKKLETIIGEKGTRLSGGEYAKIILSRLFYHQKKIIIMDESTNFLDVKSEKSITEEIRKLKGKKTIIIISHNSNSLKYCNKIYKLENYRLTNKKSLF